MAGDNVFELHVVGSFDPFEAAGGDGSWLIVPVRVMVDADYLAAARAILDAPPPPDWPAAPGGAAC